MKKLFNLIIIFALSFSLISCSNSSKEFEKVVNKKYQGYKQHQILVIKDKLYFQKNKDANPSNVNDSNNLQKLEDEKLKEFSNPKIVNKDGKNYLTADNFEHKLLIVDDNTIVDEENNYKYVFVQNLFDKK